MHKPNRFIFKGEKDHVCKLKEPLYVLKHFPKKWYKHFDILWLIMVNLEVTMIVVCGTRSC